MMREATQRLSSLYRPKALDLTGMCVCACLERGATLALIKIKSDKYAKQSTNFLKGSSTRAPYALFSWV